MKRVYEIDTWRVDEKAKALNNIAIAAARQYNGRKWIVSDGEWGVKTYMVLAESKEEAKSLAPTETDKIKVREVTNCKKYK